jgi:hypothetical protein
VLDHYSGPNIDLSCDMASISIDYSSLPLSGGSKLGSFDFELEQMPASEFVRTSRSNIDSLTNLVNCHGRATSHTSTSTGFVGASEEQQDPLVKKSSFSSARVRTQTLSQKPGPQRPNRGKRRKLQGWRFGLAVSVSAATFVLVANVLLVVGAASASKLENGIGFLHVGKCDVVNKWNTALHVLINAFSSLLLSTSNYAMQCLNSPTRSECDHAHARRDWLDIGVNGVRNLTRISRRRRILWTLLAISSIPIHLLFNSAVFKTLDANEYDYSVVRKDFLEGASIVSYNPYVGSPEPVLPEKPSEFRSELESAQQRYLERISSCEYLSPRDCILTYGGAFVSGHSNLFLVTENSSTDINFFATEKLHYNQVDGDDGPLTENFNLW